MFILTIWLSKYLTEEHISEETTGYNKTNLQAVICLELD